MKSFLKNNWFKLCIIIVGVSLVVVVGFYLNNKNKLEVERQRQESTQREIESQRLEKEKQDQIKAQEIKATEIKKVYVPIKDTAVEMEKCRYKYVDSREFDSETDLNNFGINFKNTMDLNPNLDRDMVYKALEDMYFSQKYKGCLSNIK